MTLLRLAVMIVVCTQLAASAEEQRTSLTNADVIKMSTLGFSEQVMLAKVKQAASTEFTVEIADIEILQKEGVPQAVIAAMLERSSATTLVSTTVPAPASMVEPASPEGSRPASEVPVVTGPMGLEPASEVGTVRLMTKESWRSLPSEGLSVPHMPMSRCWCIATTLEFAPPFGPRTTSHFFSCARQAIQLDATTS